MERIGITKGGWGGGTVKVLGRSKVDGSSDGFRVFRWFS